MPAVTRSENVGLRLCFPADCEFNISCPAWAMCRGAGLKATLLYAFSLIPSGDTGFGVPRWYGSLSPYDICPGDMMPGRLSFGLPSILLLDGLIILFGDEGLETLLKAVFSCRAGTCFEGWFLPERRVGYSRLSNGSALLT